MNGKNPCECCDAKDKASGCNHCALDGGETTCTNSECSLNVEDSCMIGIADTCKASPEFEDKKWFHDCEECVHCCEEANRYLCDVTGEERGLIDESCDNFEERRK